MPTDETSPARPGRTARRDAREAAGNPPFLKTTILRNRAEAVRLAESLDDKGGTAWTGMRSRLDVAPTRKRVLEAFSDMPPSRIEETAIAVLIENPGTVPSVLSAAVGWGGETWLTHFAMMCRERIEWLRPPMTGEAQDDVFFASIIADRDHRTGAWTMKPEVVKAFATLGFAADSDTAGAA